MFHKTKNPNKKNIKNRSSIKSSNDFFRPSLNPPKKLLPPEKVFESMTQTYLLRQLQSENPNKMQRK